MAAKMKMCPVYREPCIRDECVAWGTWRKNPGAGFVPQTGCKYFQATEQEMELKGKGRKNE